MSEYTPELIIKGIALLAYFALIVYSLVNNQSLKKTISEAKEALNMYKIRNKDGSITVVTEPTETVSEVVAAEPVKEKTEEVAEVKVAEPVATSVSKSVPIAKAVEPVKEETALEKAEKLIDSLTDCEAKELFQYITNKLFK